MEYRAVVGERLEVPGVGEGLASRTIARVPGGRRLPPAARALVTIALLGLLILAALLTEPWGFMALGSAVGLLVIAGVPAARAGLMPVAALGRAALPLLLPLFVFVAAGVVKSPRELQFAVGLTTLLVAWFWLIRPDFGQIRAVLERRSSWRSAARGLTQVGLPAVLALIALAFLGLSIIRLVGDSEETARSLFVVAVGLLAGAAVLRLLGYARTAFRALVALALLLLLARLAVEIGVLAGGRVPEKVSAGTFALVAGGLLALTAVVEILTSVLARGAEEQTGQTSDQLPAGIRTAAFLETPIAARWLTDRANVLGLGLSVLSALLLLCAVFAASLEGGADEHLNATPRSGQPPKPPSRTGDKALAAMFSPVLVFTEDQRWTPIAVDDYVRGATIRDWEGRKDTVRAVGDLGTRCPGVVKSPCYVMTQLCRPKKDAARCAEDLSDEKAAYVRVARRPAWRHCKRTRPCADGSPNPFAVPLGRYARDTEILVQYWYFYPFNEWVAPVVIGDLKEVHAADWEAVTIGLSADKPLWAAYSAHCGGTFADWDKIRVAEQDPRHLRPLVAVARGSQANYRVARENRVPNFAECSGIQKDRLTLASYAANIRDQTDDSKVWDPGSGDLRLVTAETPPMSFPGRWAPHSRMTLENFRKGQQLGKDGPGPQTPSLQALWQTPMHTIFRGGAWKEG